MILFIDNYDSFSYNIVQYFQMTGREPRVLTNDDPRVLEAAADPELEAVVLSPGPSNPEHAGYCLEFLARLPKHIPVLGICLGHQCLGAFAGCSVERGPKVMHGNTSDIVHDGTGLYAGVRCPMTIGRYHSLVVKVPAEHPLLEVTARDEDGEVMSLRYKDRPWVGVQYHPESILTTDGLQLIANFPHNIL
ncbi:MAG: anthranilate synthase component II [Akkermansia sp.]